jgi:hypothetical protein
MGTTKIRVESKPNFSNAIALSLLPYKYKFPKNQNSRAPLNQGFFGWLDKAIIFFKIIYIYIYIPKT